MVKSKEKMDKSKMDKSEMDKSMEASGKKTYKLLIFMCWAMYVIAYFGRYSYNSNITLIQGHFGTSNAETGLAVTFFFFSYGVGQVINGLLCKHYNKRFVLAGAMMISALLNLTVFLGMPFSMIKYLWLVNGIVQSTLWSSLVMLLSETLPADKLKTAVIVMSTTTACGNILCYGASSLFAIAGDYRYSFLFGAVTLGIMSVLWVSVCRGDLLKRKDFGAPTEMQGALSREALSHTEVSNRKGLGTLLLLTIGMLAIFAIVDNLIKDGLSTWVPAILKSNYGLSDSVSILLSLALPLCGIFGATVATLLNRKIKSFVLLGTIFFTVAGLSLGAVILLCGVDSSLMWIPILLLFSVIVCAMYAVNNIITSMAPLYMRDSVNTGALAGILNGFCYVGSTISSYGLGSISDAYGWLGTFKFLLIVAILPIVLGAVFSAIHSIKKRS